jgi:hypothetical protein
VVILYIFSPFWYIWSSKIWQPCRHPKVLGLDLLAHKGATAATAGKLQNRNQIKFLITCVGIGAYLGTFLKIVAVLLMIWLRHC